MLEMDPAAKYEQEQLELVKPIESATAGGDSDVQQFYRGAVVFITGGTGFIGKQLLEKLFRSCDIKKAYVLIRSKRGKSTAERLQDMLSDPVFAPVLKKKPDLGSRVVVVEGDMASLQLGISNDEWSTIIEEVDIIFHVAATVRFDEHLRTAALINVRGTREVLALGRACKKLRSFVHVSTAYCHATPEHAGTDMKEEFHASPMSAEDLLSLVDSLKKEELDHITQSILDGWPNTYTFTKAVAEELVRTEGAILPICVFRPSIVVQAYLEPLPGWMDLSCMYGPNGMFIGAGTGVLRVAFINNSLKLSYVPVNFVNNAIIAAGWDTGMRKLQKPMIYTISNTRCGITFKYASDILKGPRGRAFASPVSIWYCFLIETHNRLAFWFLSWVLHYIPAYIVDTLMAVFKIKKPPGLKSFVHLYNKYDRMSNVFSHFVINEWKFDDSNLQSLWQKLSDTDKVIYNFDVTSMDWEEYVMNGVIGGRRYIMKDGLKGTLKAVEKQKWLKLANYAVLACYLIVVWMGLRCLWLLLNLFN